MLGCLNPGAGAGHELALQPIKLGAGAALSRSKGSKGSLGEALLTRGRRGPKPQLAFSGKKAEPVCAWTTAWTLQRKKTRKTRRASAPKLPPRIRKHHEVGSKRSNTDAKLASKKEKLQQPGKRATRAANR